MKIKKIKRNHKLCPNCKTGRYTTLLDSKSPFCPYLVCHNGKSCARFVPIEVLQEQHKVIVCFGGLWQKIVNWIEGNIKI